MMIDVIPTQTVQTPIYKHLRDVFSMESKKSESDSDLTLANVKSVCDCLHQSKTVKKDMHE